MEHALTAAADTEGEGPGWGSATGERRTSGCAGTRRQPCPHRSIPVHPSRGQWPTRRLPSIPDPAPRCPWPTVGRVRPPDRFHSGAGCGASCEPPRAHRVIGSRCPDRRRAVEQLEIGEQRDGPAVPVDPSMDQVGARTHAAVEGKSDHPVVEDQGVVRRRLDRREQGTLRPGRAAGRPRPRPRRTRPRSRHLGRPRTSRPRAPRRRPPPARRGTPRHRTGGLPGPAPTPPRCRTWRRRGRRWHRWPGSVRPTGRTTTPPHLPPPP